MIDYFFDQEVFQTIRKSLDTPSYLWAQTQPRPDFDFPKETAQPDIYFNSSPVEITQSFTSVLKKRRSTLLNAFNGQMTLDETMKLLQLVYEPTGHRKIAEGVEFDLFSYPSGGALYGVKTYVYINNVIGISQGIYKVSKFGLSFIGQEELDSIEKITPMTVFKNDPQNDSFEHANMIFFLIGDFSEMIKKYGLLSYKLLYLEAGHLAQNIQLVATALGVHSLPMGGCFSDVIADLLTEEDSEIIYSLAVG